MSAHIEESTVFRLNAGLVSLVTPTGTMSLLLERRGFLVSDPLIEALIRVLQQPQSFRSILQQTCPPHNPVSIRETIEELFAERIIAVADSRTVSRNSAAFWDMSHCGGPCRPVAIVSLLPKFGGSLEGLLKANNVEISADADLAVIVADDYLRPEVADLAANRKAVLLAKPVGNEIWIGPYLSNGAMLCWECLAYWLRLRRWPELKVTGLSPLEQAPSTSVAWLTSTMTMATGLIATAVTLWAAERCPDQIGRHLWTFDIHAMESKAFTVMARRDCPQCSPAANQDPALFLTSLLSPKTGIVERLREPNGRVGSVHLANCGVLLPLPKGGIRDLLAPLSADGKGGTAEEAVRRCTMEAIERYSAVFVGDEELRQGCFNEVDCISPDQLSTFSAAQYAAREEWNRRPGMMHRVPEPFDQRRPTAWAKAWSLSGEPDRYIPAGYAYLGYPFPEQPIYNYADTNGCAAGDAREDATLRGLLELIERDAVAIWWYNRLKRPGVDLQAWDDPDVQAIKNTLAAHGRSLDLLELTHDLQLPVYVAVSADGKGERVFFGCAADVCGVRAAKRALAELTQFWYWGTHSGSSLDHGMWLNSSSLQVHTYLKPASRAGIPRARPLATKEALAHCVGGLRHAGLEAYVIDLTRPELGTPVVRLVSPGLRHYGPRFAPGRLYKVPVTLGWRDEPLLEEEMNPTACVL